jgi:glutaredoxin
MDIKYDSTYTLKLFISPECPYCATAKHYIQSQKSILIEIHDITTADGLAEYQISAPFTAAQRILPALFVLDNTDKKIMDTAEGIAHVIECIEQWKPKITHR